MATENMTSHDPYLKIKIANAPHLSKVRKMFYPYIIDSENLPSRSRPMNDIAFEHQIFQFVTNGAHKLWFHQLPDATCSSSLQVKPCNSHSIQPLT